MKTVLVTGGAGYVGSHACKAFVRAGWRVVVFDNLSRGWRDFVRYGEFFDGDIRDSAAVAAALATHKPELVAHFAGLTYVPKSMSHPELYYDHNVRGTQVLIDQMRAADMSRLVFSSTCATYGIPTTLPINEAEPQSPVNPYGRTKLIVEEMLRDYGHAYGFNSISLRYFNASGCDADGEVGERHVPETHIIPLIIDAALGVGKLIINGANLDTPDGTALRDYIHVADLAEAHVLAGERLLKVGGVDAFNLGTGSGVSIKQLIAAASAAVGNDVPFEFGPPRPGDPPALVADARKANQILGWIPTQSGLENIMGSAVAWRRAELARMDKARI